jgi:hypothetical protein
VMSSATSTDAVAINRPRIENLPYTGWLEKTRAILKNGWRFRQSSHEQPNGFMPAGFQTVSVRLRPERWDEAAVAFSKPSLGRPRPWRLASGLAAPVGSGRLTW